MIGTVLSAQDVRKPLREAADVCIIGSGCGGAAAADVLSAAGRSVVIVEEGRHARPADIVPTEEWAFTNLYRQRAGLATEDLSVTVLQGQCVGGSSFVNWTTSLRTPEFTLDWWVRGHGLGSLSPSAIDPFLSRVERRLNVTVEPEHRHNSQNRNLLRGASALGYRARASGRNVRDCVELGVCGFGCPSEAKLSVNVTYLRDAQARGTSIVSDARAERIERSGDRWKVAGSMRGGTPFTIEARTVVVAASATSSPLLLERSGLASPDRHAGDHLTFHLTTAVIGMYDTVQEAWKGIPQSAICDEFLNARGDRSGFWVECSPFGPALAAMSVPSFGAEHARLMALLPNISVFIVLVNDTDSEGTVRDNGHGRPAITYRRGPRDRRVLREAIATAARMHFAAGARSVATLHTTPLRIDHPGAIDRSLRGAAWGPNDITAFSAHPLGTCRMGRDARSSVVDEHGAVHGHRGLYVLDGSILPSSLGVNPQVTILAVAEKHAQRIAENWPPTRS